MIDLDMRLKQNLDKLLKVAWKYRESAFVIGPTKVGAAVLTKQGLIFGGCNVEHRFRCHDVHAEVNAIGSMVAEGHTDLEAIVIVAERERFTPCGGCLDWILQFGGATCIVARQSKKGGERVSYLASELMPHFPF
jgi:cytidine deaminase